MTQFLNRIPKYGQKSGKVVLKPESPKNGNANVNSFRYVLYTRTKLGYFRYITD
jgi:hypothetical protein